MEFLNKIELRGIVGRVNATEIGGETAVRFSVATDYSYKHKKVGMVVETTWHNCTAWSSKCPDAKRLERGSMVHLTGRLRSQKYADANGDERTITEVLVQSLEIL